MRTFNIFKQKPIMKTEKPGSSPIDSPDLIHALECALTQIDDLSEALEWALTQIEDSLDPDHEAALNAALFTLAKAKGEA